MSPGDADQPPPTPSSPGAGDFAGEPGAREIILPGPDAQGQLVIERPWTVVTELDLLLFSQWDALRPGDSQLLESPLCQDY